MPEFPLKPVLDLAPLGVLYLDEQQRIRYCNASLEILLGRTADELLGQSALAFLPDLGEHIGRGATGTWRLIEYKGADGELSQGRINIRPVPLADDSATAVYLRTLTEEERAYQAMADAEALLNAFMSNNTVLTWMKDEDLRYVYANGPYQELMGMDTEDMVGKTDYDFRGAATADELRANDLVVMQSGRKLEALEFLLDADGRPHYHQVYKFPFQDRTGRRYVGGLSVDITPVKEAEQALGRSEANYRSLFENVLDGIYRTTVDGKLLAANPALVRMLGYNSEEELREADVGSDLYADPSQRERLQAQLVSEGATRNVEINVRRRDGSVITVLDNSHLVRNEAGDVLYSEGTLTDITALKERERELQEAYDATIEGWSRAMDLRDRETQGHTQRVAYVTEKMAREFGVPEEDVVHLRRGALLHDIGKMGIPDNVLRKTGELTDNEWDVMRRHPQYAQDMLWPIKYLRPALAIPYCHHEKWDGSGYPRGLKGEAIPLAARLFAVADVWDALRSDRPYRKAWGEAEVLAYIREEGGKHFDPQVAAYFLDNVSKFKFETASLGG